MDFSIEKIIAEYVSSTESIKPATSPNTEQIDNTTQITSSNSLSAAYSIVKNDSADNKAETEQQNLSIDVKDKLEIEFTELSDASALTQPKSEETTSENEPFTESIKNYDEDNYANFKGKVYTAQQAFPVNNAKIIIAKDGEIYSFLTTNSSGETDVVKIKSPPRENSLDPYSTDKSTNYYAQIYADGFATQKNLLVSAVGGTSSLLNSELIPM